MVLSKNEVILNDAMLYGDPKTITYIDTHLDYSISMNVRDGESINAFVSIYLLMDDTIKYTERNVATFAKAFANTGGFMTIIFMVALIIVQRLQASIYYSTLIQSFYKY